MGRATCLQHSVTPYKTAITVNPHRIPWDSGPRRWQIGAAASQAYGLPNLSQSTAEWSILRGWVVDRKPASLESVQSQMIQEIKGRIILSLCRHPLTRSRCPAVFNAALCGNARPWQQAAEETLGLAVYPVRNGTWAQAGER